MNRFLSTVQSVAHGRWRLPIAARSIILSPLVGIVAGAGAIAFHLLCLLITHVSLRWFVGYEQAGPELEAGFKDVFGTVGDLRPLVPWLLLLVPTAGGLLSGLLVYLVAPEAEGHGTDAAIDAYHNRGGVVRARVPIVKMIASALTLGTGGSGGREGPIAQIGAGFGSFLATRLNLSDHDRRTLLAAGMGAGIGAIFHAPLAGAIFAIEVLYRDPDFEAEALIPAFIATAVSFCTFGLGILLLTGETAFHPLFAIPDGIRFDEPLLLLPLMVLAAAMAAASYGYVRCFYGVQALFRRLPVPAALKPAIGALCTGLVALGAWLALGPLGSGEDGLSVLSFGYGFLQKVLNPGGTTIVITTLLVVGLGKILTTSLTIGSGGSGGVFGPSMVIGGALGAVVGLLFHQWLPDLVRDHDVIMFAILGMASFFAAAANTPVSTLIMVSELTASYDLLLPSMWVCALAYVLARRWSIYREQVGSRLDSPAHRGDFIIDVLEGMTVRQALSNVHREFTSVKVDTPLKQIGRLITATRQICFPVVSAEGTYRGLFGLNDVREFLYDASDLAELAVAEDLAAEAEPLTLNMELSGAIGRFAQSGFEELPVVDEREPDRVIGLLRRQDVIAAYSSQLLALREPQATAPNR